METNKVTDPAVIAQLQGYQQHVMTLKSSPYMDYPQHVHLETLGLCNASCSFCPYPSMKRKGVRMSDELIEKIFTDLAAIPPELQFQLSLFKVNEPFLDTRLFSLLGTIRTRLPNALVSLTTNAQPLTEAKLDLLLGASDLLYLWISLNEYEAEPYHHVMGLNFDITLQRLHMLHRRAQQGMKLNIVLSRVSDGTARDNAFIEYCQHEFPLFQATLFPRGSWLGQVDNLRPAPIFGVACQRWFELSITCTGEVAHCCMDGQAQYPIGDVNKQSVLDIYNSAHYRALREKAVSRLDISPCNQCSFL